MDEKTDTVQAPLLTFDVRKEEIISKQKTEQSPVKTSYFQIFRYASWSELAVTILGVILGVLSGGNVCYSMIQIGELSTSFVERTSFPERLSSYLPMTTFFGGGRRLINASHEENMAALIEDANAVAISILLSQVVGISLSIASVGLVNWSALRQITRIRILFLRAVLHQEMAWFDTDSKFNFASKMSEDLMNLKEGIGEKLSIVSNLLGTALFCVVFAFPLGWELTLACISVMPFSIVASIALSNYQSVSSMREMESNGLAGKHAEETLKSIRTIVAFSGEKNEIDRYTNLLQPAEKQGRKRGLYAGLGTGFSWVLTYSLNTIGLAYGTRLYIQDLHRPDEERKYLIGVIFAIMGSIYMAIQSITLCVPHAETFATARGAAAGIFPLLQREPKINRLKQKGFTPKQVKGEVQMENVHFNYPSRPEVEILQGLSLHIKAGENVILVGSSGCGKSTILQLIQRLYEIQSGSVKFDGKPIENLNLEWLRSCLGVVGQEPVLFRGTIFENIAMGFPEATEKDVQRVAEKALVHDFVQKLPDGYNTMIGERGTSLSGGQKQRIAIARALLREPAVLLLDEATSALDPHSEREVQAALDNASIGRTTISVSHRLATIRNAHRIICMDKGKIVEQGTYDELMKNKGYYYELMVTEKKKNEIVENGFHKVPSKSVMDEMPGGLRSELANGTDKLGSKIIPVQSAWVTPTARGSIVSIASGVKKYALAEFEDDSGKINTVSDWQLMKFNAPEWIELTIGSIAAVIQGACFPTFAVLIGFSFGIFALQDADKIISWADFYSGIFMIIAAVAGAAMCVQSITYTSAGLKMTTRLRHQYFEALLRQEIGYFDKASNAVGVLCARLSGDTAEIQGATGLRIGLILQGLSSVLIGFIVAMCYSWKLTLTAAAFLPLMVGSVWIEGIISTKAQADEREAMETATAIATEAVVSIKTVQSLGLETTFLQKFKEALDVACNAVTSKTKWRGLVFSLSLNLPFLSYASVIIYGAYLIAYGEVAYQTVTLVNEAVMYGAYMLGQSLVYVGSFSAARSCGARILAMVSRQPKVKTEEGIVDKEGWMASGEFSIKNIDFSYPTRPEQKILKEINLSVKAGKTIALVGSSGSGKSTVLQLMQRFYDPNFGSIELDNHDIQRSLTLPRLRRQLGVVQQEPVLFDRTIAENIAYGDNSRKVSMDEIVEAAKAANIHSFIVSLPKGYETSLGSNGAQLSGGQKQRICIARALIRSPRLLLLDEATSALDANSERAVSEALEKAAKGRTCITIAHRLSTIENADQICVLDKGKIVEVGTHTELLAANGHYYRLWRGQNSIT